MGAMGEKHYSDGLSREAVSLVIYQDSSMGGPNSFSQHRTGISNTLMGPSKGMNAIGLRLVDRFTAKGEGMLLMNF